MYRGVSSHHVLPRVTSYEAAQRCLGVKLKGDTVTVYERGDGAIAFRLYQTDVVAWHSTDEFEVDNYGTVTTSGFARHFVPSGVWLDYPVERRATGPMGANTIRFASGTQVCQGSVVMFQPNGDHWAADPATCYDITLPTGVDRKSIRQLALDYHLREFESWLTVAPITLGNVEHAEWDLDECLHALKRRDWRQAAMHLPLIKEPNGFGTAERMKPLPIATPWNHHVTMGSLSKLKLAMWEDRGLLLTETRPVWDAKAFARGVAKMKEMDGLGLDVRVMGPRT